LGGRKGENVDSQLASQELKGTIFYQETPPRLLWRFLDVSEKSGEEHLDAAETKIVFDKFHVFKYSLMRVSESDFPKKFMRREGTNVSNR